MDFRYEGEVLAFQAMRRPSNLGFFVLVLTTLVVGGSQPSSLHAQAITLDRKVKTKVAPVYPEIARRMGLSGSVRLEVVIAPNGTVKDTKVIGGHPILVNAALDAVKKWKFETGTSDSTGMLEFNFEPGT